MSLIDPNLDRLISAVYGGPLEAAPWAEFLRELKVQMVAKSTTLVLKAPSDGDRGVVLTEGAVEEGLATYQDSLYEMDPFIDLPPGEVKSLLDFVSPEELLSSELYTLCMKPAGLYDSIGMDLVVPDEMEARLRVARGLGDPEFGEAERELCRAIAPHLTRAIRLHVRMNRLESERQLYASAIDDLAVATIILDENGELLSSNRMALDLVAEHGDVFFLVDNAFRIRDRETQRNLEGLVAVVIQAKASEVPSVQAMSIPTKSGALGLVVRPVPHNAWSEGKRVPKVALFLSDPKSSTAAPADVLTRLFGFTPTEAQLALLLAQGLSLDESAADIGCSRNTARSHLRSLFMKTGVSRQTLLVRMILQSVAALASSDGV